MTCCGPKARKLIIFGFGVLLLIIGILVGAIWPPYVQKLLEKELVLKEGSLNYNNWIETPIPIYFELYLYNWTNSDKVHDKSVKPHFEQMGPYVFVESHKRVQLEWHENHTISFNQTRKYIFDQSLSNGTLDDKITNLNVISATVAYTMRDMNPIFKFFVNSMLNNNGGSLFVTKTAGELLFDGYEDPLLKFIKGFNMTTINIPFDTFGWFVGRNGSSEYDGRFNMNTGADDLKNLGNVNLWKQEKTTGVYRDECSVVTGSTGELFPPLNIENDVTVFTTDLCRTISITPTNKYTKFGITGHKWVGDYRVLDNGRKYPPASCYCTSALAQCPDLPYGVTNVSDCKFGAPAFVSYPHFYLADPIYLADITGLSPNKEDHEFYVALEPKTGIPLDVRAQLQINLLLQNIEHLTMYENVPDLMVPMMWFRQLAGVDATLAKSARLALSLPSIGIYVAYGAGGIGVILVLIGIVISICHAWGEEDDSELLIHRDSASRDDTEIRNPDTLPYRQGEHER